MAISGSVNKHEIKFDRMINDLTLSPEAIECIDSTKQRLIFRGVAAGVVEPQVRNAFCIVYRDLAPIRVAGDLIFRQLSAVAQEASQRDDGIVETNATDLVSMRVLFDMIDGDDSGGLDRKELIDSPKLLALIREESDSASKDAEIVDRFMELADENGDGKISFVEFANAAATQPRLRLVDDVLTAALLSSTSRLAENNKKGTFGLRKSPETRFDEMLQQCLLWEQDLGCGPDDEGIINISDEEECMVDVQILEKESGKNQDDDSRMLQVLKGSLVGARIEPVVEALKMCYLDYSPIRLGGDVIFKLLKRVVKTQIPKTE